jgi:3-deoxy-7-phosphoheptulonate synthase
MLVSLTNTADAGHVSRELARRGLWVKRLENATGVHFFVGAHSAEVAQDDLRSIDGVADVARPNSAHPLVDSQGPLVTVGDHTIGEGAYLAVLAGPCSVESETQIHAVAARVAAAGATMLRGGAYKPRTSPYAFQGHGRPALQWMVEAARANGLGVVTEVLDPADAVAVAEHADLLQIGSRNMHNQALLRAAGATGKPILVKRGMAATVEEWLCAGEACLLHGASGVIFCERGIRGFDPQTRNVLDLGSVALLAHALKLPVIVDPSHATGRRDLIPALAHAATGAGAHGLLLETHDDPGTALSDGPQALHPDEFDRLMGSLTRPVRPTAGARS